MNNNLLVNIQLDIFKQIIYYTPNFQFRNFKKENRNDLSYKLWFKWLWIGIQIIVF